MKSISDVINTIIFGSDGKELSEYWENKIATSNEEFCCDYCGKLYSIRELHFSAEMDTKYESAVSTFGRPAIKSSHDIYMVKICSRCNKVHNIAGWIHFIVAIVCIVVAISLSWKDAVPFEDYAFPILIAIIIAQIIRFVDWFFITLLFDVKRKPRKI